MRKPLLFLLLTLCVLGKSSWAQLTRGNLVVLQVGAGGAALTNASTAIFLKEYTTSGTAGNTVTIPTSGINALTASGTAGSEGQISRASDGSAIIIPGYNSATGVTSIANTTSSAQPRGIGSVNGSGTFTLVDTTRVFFSANNIRSATSDGTRYWAVGGTSGVVYYPGFFTTGTSISLPNNSRVVSISNNQLLLSTGAGTTGVYVVGNGLPTASVSSSIMLASTSPYAFSLNAQGNVCYVADDGAGIRKYTFNGSTWSQAYILNTTTVTGLTVDYSTAYPVVYATTATPTTGANRIIRVTDSGASGATAFTVATAASQTIFRGIAFCPSGVFSLSNFSGVTALSGVQGTAGTPGSFQISGANLTNDATITAPTNFEVSLDNVTYSSSVTATRSGTTLSGQPVTVYVRTTAGASAGAVSGTVTIASTGASGNSVNVSGTISVPTPALTVSNQSGLTGQSALSGVAGTPGSFTVSGANLTANATVTAPTNFEVSTDNVTYSSSVTLTRSGATLSGQPITVYVRINSTAPTGSVSGNVTVASTGATTQTVAVSGTVTANATLTISNQSGLIGQSTTQGTAGTPASFQVSGTSLTANVIVTAPTNFEVATSAGGTYSSSLTLTQSGGTLLGQPVTVYVRITAAALTGYVSGNVTVTSTGATTQSVAVDGNITGPTLGVGSASGLTTLTSVQGQAGSTPGSFAVSGANLTGNVTVAPASTDFEVSSDNITYSSNLTLTQSGGMLANQPVTVYVRLSATAPAGSVSGTVNVTSTGAVTQNVNVGGTVAAPSLAASPTSLSGFSSSPSTASSSQSFTLTGANLAANTSVSVTTGFELSLNDTTYTTSALSLSPTSNSLSRVIYVRAAAGNSLGSSSGTVTAANGTASATVTLSGQVTQPFTAGNLVVARIGDGTSTLANTGNAAFLEEYTPAGVLVQTITIPTAVNGSNRRLVLSGSSTSEGILTRSADGQYLTIAGYDATIPYASSLASTASATVNRTVGLIDYRGYVDVTTALSDFATGNNPRVAFTTNGTDIWVGGGAGGVRYATKGRVGTSTQVSSTLTNVRTLNYAESGKDTGQLFMTHASGSTVARVAEVGVGTPTNTGNTIVGLSGITTSAGVFQCFFADLNDTIPGVDVVYTAIDSGGIIKYSYNGTSWTTNGTMDNAVYRGLTGKVDASGSVTLYAIRGFGTNYSDSGSLVMMTDATGWNATPSASPVVTALVTKNLGSKHRFSGVAFAPVNNSATGNTKLWTGNGSARYGFAGNWSGFSKPTTTSNVVISANGFYAPRLFADTQNAANLTIQANTSLNLLNNGALNVYGAITNNGTFNTTDGTVNFQSTGTQTVPALTARNLTFNGSGFTLSGDVTVTNSLTFTSGIVDLGSNNLSVAQGATLNGGSATAFARTNSSGRLKAFVSTTPVTFPVGVSAYNPATLTNDGTGATETGFSIRLVEGVVENGTSGAAVTKPVVNRTWLIEEDGTGTPNASLTLQWNSGEVVNGFSPTQVYVAHYNTTTSKWEPLVADVSQAPAASGNDPYTVTATGITSFSPFTVASSGSPGPLPVRISTLSAFANGRQNLLRWDSYEEEPGLRYRAEYAPDGKTFSPISEITAAGYAQSYTVKHQPEQEGNAYYRIAVLELNGKVSYSNTAVVKATGTETPVGSVYPNPATDYLQLQMSGDLSADATLKVIDASGRVVIDEPLKTQPAIVDLRRLPVGIYQMHVMNAGQVEMYRIVKQ